MSDFMMKLKDIWFNYKKWVIIGIIALICIIALIVIPNSSGGNNKDEISFADFVAQKQAEAGINKSNKTDSNSNGITGTDDVLIKRQDKLVAKYGAAPEGFIYDYDGSLLSLGDKEKSAEEVIYIYLQSLSKLDIANAEKYSRDANCVERYAEYYSSHSLDNYEEQFNRNIYAEVLKSLEIKKVESTASFSQNKQIYTVQARIKDLTNKDFWMNDSKKVFLNLATFGDEELDSTKANNYLYEYILNYYKGSTAVRRTINFDITVEKFADIDTGWLVTTDADLDNACVYKDGKSVMSYMKTKFKEYKREERLKGK